ncbi:protein STU1 [Dothidotthia symphoricarpi CBS 119687]|uniref:Protein STU1 n=1 Tax=Dothidotthia symphoricarpi CBS 119687 TaxID=1392245 RepID=A0A6A6A8W2_9PLEO|nr:protein STU1 [Dothidotthia symphoricarpi CBS 119687]KAF2127645.1 protein STU1 [Dothidotthia symphoricarpi CBS 119687]
MEEQTATLLAALKKPSTNVDQRLQLFNNLKSGIKHNRVPESCQADIFECIRIAITAATSAALVTTGFSTLSHFIKRLQLQKETQIITSQASTLCAILSDRLGDAREGHRSAASQILAELHYLSHAEVDEVIHNAIAGSNARAKETSMTWIVKMNKHESVPFKTYVPFLVANLEDADAVVRETAKKAVVELFRSAPEHAKANLKKQLATHNVRKTIAAYITSHLDDDAMSKDAELAPPPPPERPITTKKAVPRHTEPSFTEAELPPPVETVSMDPIHLYTQREMEDMFRDMGPAFEGRESEGNWLARDKNATKLRRILKGNAPTEFHSAFIAGIKGLLDGILKVANTLRTTMSTNGCQLVQELAKTLGPAIDPWVEILLQSFVKMCAATKNIAAQNGNITVDAIISNASYNSRLLQHVAFAAQDKNVQPRSHSATWIKTLIRKHKGQIDHSGGLETLDKIIKKGVTDANPKVREAYRSTYWTFALVWPQRAEIMFETFEKREKTALEKDPNNPDTSLASSQSSAATFSKSVGAGAARTALKEKIAEQRRAKLAASSKGVPERPMSAAATYSPPKSVLAKSLGARTTSTTSIASAGTARPPSAMSGESTKSALKSSTGTGSLMSGTVRRPMRRPELVRPATADPYAARRAGKDVPSMTPEKTPAVVATKKPAVPKSIARPRSQTQNSPNVSPVRSKSRIATHRKTPSMSSQRDSPATSPAKDSDMAERKRFSRSQSHHDAGTIPFKHRNGMEKGAVGDNDVIDTGDEDNFTMVIPNLARPPAQPMHHTPPKTFSGRIPIPSPRTSLLKRPKSIGDLNPIILRGTQSPRIRSPDRPSTRGTDAQEEVQVYEDPFVGDEPASAGHQANKPVLEELPINEKSNERRRSSDLADHVMMDDAGEERPRGHHKTTSTGNVTRAENTDTNNAEALKNKQLLVSGIKKIEARTVEAHMFRRMQDVVKSHPDIWIPNDENFTRLLTSSLAYLEAPVENLQTSPLKAVNLKVQALATIRALLSMYRRETAKYSSQVLTSLLHTKAQYENTSHIAIDLETTAAEIVKYGHTLDCLDAVLALVEHTPTSPPMSSSSLNSKSSVTLIPTPSATRTTTMALASLAALVNVTRQKNLPLPAEQTARLGRLAVRCMDDADADVRKADVEFCIALHERISKGLGEKGGAEGGGGFWRAVAGAREQHLNLLTYYLAKRGVA